jgi:hypothetical protein
MWTALAVVVTIAVVLGVKWLLYFTGPGNHWEGG